MHLAFFLGVIVGLVIAIVVFVILTFFRASIERTTKIIETRISNAGPRPRGSIFIPRDDEDEDAEEERQRIIQENNKKGVDTPLKDLL